MKLAIEIPALRPDTLKLTVDWVQHAEKLGCGMAFAAEAWWSDSVTPLAYLADKTTSIQLATGIMQTTARTPAMTAMTALTLHDLTNGRFVLGLGASGPQVVEGLHGVKYNPALSRLKDTVNICRMIFRGKKSSTRVKPLLCRYPIVRAKPSRSLTILRICPSTLRPLDQNPWNIRGRRPMVGLAPHSPLIIQRLTCLSLNRARKKIAAH